ncbi:hypothetical protein [Echinicola vietnamensis]|uniref:HEPN AbiU2-like domain-containing protein n=1 Tax=Echinicola vietnamensis (strain DSM 17526 / LMG 23754 / KMM 6221) TaxID=926556 RepID=L0G1Z5_ECHVK|nr:hypothetical protein [Echinicola vietnamensis]AGA78885.1 hypothetical protein Echvi_2644 [Echinicola vietnamensis DSM 17526]
MNKIEYERLKLDYILQTHANEELFGQWLRKFFYLNSELNKEYDSIYQSSFYVVFYELVTAGLEYSKKVFESLQNSENHEKKEFYSELIGGLKILKLLFSESEFEFIEYKRHSCSHIFQNHYEKRITDKGKIITKRKGKLIDKLNKEFSETILKHGFERGFDEYMTQKLYPKITKLYNGLEKIKMQYNRN